MTGLRPILSLMRPHIGLNTVQQIAESVNINPTSISFRPRLRAIGGNRAEKSVCPIPTATMLMNRILMPLCFSLSDVIWLLSVCFIFLKRLEETYLLLNLYPF